LASSSTEGGGGAAVALAEGVAALAVVEEEADQIASELERAKASRPPKGFPWAQKQRRLSELRAAAGGQRTRLEQARRSGALRERITALCGGIRDAATAVSALSVALVSELERGDAREPTRHGAFAGTCVQFADGCFEVGSPERDESPNAVRGRREANHALWAKVLHVWVCRGEVELVPACAGRRDVEELEQAGRAEAACRRQRAQERQAAANDLWDGGNEEGISLF